MSSHWKPAEVKLLRERFACGDSDKWIGAALGHLDGCSPRTAKAVGRKRIRLDLRANPELRSYPTRALVVALRGRGVAVEWSEPEAEPDAPKPSEAPKPTWSVRGSARANGRTERGVTHTVTGSTPYAARRAWAEAVREAGGVPLPRSANVRLIEGAT